MAAGTTTQDTVDVVTPAAGESVTEGTILEWHVKIGDFIKVDDTIVEISTDKVDVELPSPASGTVSEILAEEGDTVGVGQVIARLVLGEGADGNGGGPPQAEQPSDARAQSPETVPEPQAKSGNGATQTPDGLRVSPVAARAADAEGVDLASVEGSGPGGRIVKADVLEAANGATVTAERQLLRGGAAMLARYMDESRSIPTATSFRTITVTTLDARRRELKESGRKVSFTHLIAYAIVKAAEQMGVMTHHFEEVEGKPYRVDDRQVNLGLAVDIE
jgi:2-oxoglutarate decarboxylase